MERKSEGTGETEMKGRDGERSEKIREEMEKR